MPVKGRLFHRAQTVVQDVTTVTAEEHLREVMEGNRYPDTCSTGLASSLYRCVWIPVTFRDFTQGVNLLLLWSYPEQQFVPVKGRLFHRAQTAVQGVTMVKGEEHPL